jgi:hypothetical protein
MRALLVNRFGFREADVVQLLNGQATAEAIRREVGALVRGVQALPSAGPPAQLMIHYSGHGALAPDQPPGDPDHDEDDGLDETILPYDADPISYDRDIRDDEINDWLKALWDGGKARVWVVLDSCHSGSGCRGEMAFRRFVRQGDEKAGRPAALATDVLRRKRLPLGVVVLSACGPDEIEPEYAGDGQIGGLLTYFLTSVLNQVSSPRGISYLRLRDAIEDRYRGDVQASRGPTPQLEGDPEALASAVLAAGPEADRAPYFRATPLDGTRSRVRLDGGAIRGVTPGSAFQLYGRPEDITPRRSASDGAGLGWLLADEVGGMSSTARVVRRADDPARPWVDDVLPPGFRGGYAVERLLAGYAGRPLRVKVVRANEDGADRPIAVRDAPPTVRQALASPLSWGEPPWLMTVEGTDAPSDLLLRLDGHQGAIFPGSGSCDTQGASERGTDGAAIPTSLRGGTGPYDLLDDQAVGKIRSQLLQATRARNLLALASARSEDPGGTDLELLECQSATDPGHPWLAHNGEIRMRQGQLFRLRVRNAEKNLPLYVTVLLISPELEVQVVLPFQNGRALAAEERLGPGQHRLSGVLRCAPLFGRRVALAIATDQPHDLSALAQTRSLKHRDGAFASGPASLVEAALLSEGSRRNLRGPALEANEGRWSIGRLRWVAIP